MLLSPLIPVAGLDGGAEGGPDNGLAVEGIDAASGLINPSSVVAGVFTAGD